MEWVETTARTVEEAKEQALDQLGVAEDDAEFEVLDEPRPGLFGRLRGEARVRARVRPTSPRPKSDRRDRRRRGGSDDGDAGPATGEPVAAATPAAPTATRQRQRQRPRDGERPRSSGRTSDGDGTAGAARTKEDSVDPQQVGDEAQRFVQGLVDAFGLTATTRVQRDGDDIEVAVDGADLGLLVGPRGATLQAIQELTRVASQRRLRDHDTRLRVDVGGYRERRREALARFANQVAQDVLEAKAARRLEPMNSADRKVIHDVLATVDGVVTRSEGEEPNRRVIVAPADA